MRLQDVLDATVLALETGDFAAYRRWNGLPCLMVSDEHTQVIATEAELRQSFDAFAALVRRDPTVRMTRRVTQETPLGAALVLTQVETRVERAGRAVVDPFLSLIGWRLGPAGWEAVVAINPVRSGEWNSAAERVPETDALAMAYLVGIATKDAGA